MTSSSIILFNTLFSYKYIDLEGNEFGPFEGLKMAEWDSKGFMDDDLIIFRISKFGSVEKMQLRELRKISKTPFLEKDCFSHRSENGESGSIESVNSLSHSFDGSPSLNSKNESHINEFPDLSAQHCLGTQKTRGDTVFSTLHSSEKGADSNIVEENIPLNDSPKQYHPDVYSSPPFMRLPDSKCSTINPESARAKVFFLYQLIITVPDQLKHFPPYTSETVCCQLCKVDLTGPTMFTHLITIQHLDKVSNCIFTESDVDFWISRINNIIKNAPASALKLPGFEPELHINDTESIKDFIERNKKCTKKPSILQIKKAMHVVGAVINVVSATCYCSSKVNRSKRKLTGNFLSHVVKFLVEDVHRPTLQKKYGNLLKGHNECTFCALKFDSFYEVCRHIGTQGHRDKINNIHYHEGLVAIWVRMLARSIGNKKKAVLHRESSSRACYSPDIIMLD